MRIVSSSLELLESRIAPAGLINVSVSSAGILTLKTVAGMDGNEIASIASTVAAGDALEITPGSQVTLRIDGTDFTTPQIVFGVHGISAMLGAGSDSLLLTDLILSKGITANLGDGTNIFKLTNSTVAGAVAVTTGSGVDTVTMDGTGVAIGGAATLKLGAGMDTISAIATRLTFGKGLVVDSGSDYDSINLGTTVNSTMSVVGNLQILSGDGGDLIAIGTSGTAFAATGAVSVLDKAGSALVELFGNSFQAGSLLLNMGSGDNTLLNPVINFTLAKNFTWTSADGNDQVGITGTTAQIGGAVSIDLGKGPGVVRLVNTGTMSVGGAVMMKSAGTVGQMTVMGLGGTNILIGGALKETVLAGSSDLEVLASTGLTVGGGVTMATGAESSTLSLKGNVRMQVGGSVSLSTANAGGDLAVFSSSLGDSLINGGLTLKGGYKVSVDFAGSIVGAVKITTAPVPTTAPSVHMISNGGRGISIGGLLTVAVPSVSGATSDVTLLGLTLPNGAKVTTGAGNDTLNFDNLVSEKTFTVLAGAGNDTLKLEQAAPSPGSRFEAAVLLKGEAGADTFLLAGANNGQNVFFKKGGTVDGGAETDIVTVGNQAIFAPGFSLVQVNIP